MESNPAKCWRSRIGCLAAAQWHGYIGMNKRAIPLGMALQLLDTCYFLKQAPL